MADHGSRGGICGFRLGDHTDGHAPGPFQDFRDVFHFGVIQRILGGIFVYAHGVHHGFMAGGIGRRGVGAVGDQGIIAAGGNDRIVIQFFHGQQVVVLAVGHALGQDPGDFTGLQAHAVPYEQDHVPGPFGSLFLDHRISGSRNALPVSILGRYFDGVGAGLGEGHPVSPVGNHTVAQIFGFQFLAKEFVSRLAVDGNVNVLQVPGPFHFHVEVEFGPCPEFCLVHGQDADFSRFHTGQHTHKGTAGHNRQDCTFQPLVIHTFCLLYSSLHW